MFNSKTNDWVKDGLGGVREECHVARLGGGVRGWPSRTVQRDIYWIVFTPPSVGIPEVTKSVDDVVASQWIRVPRFLNFDVFDDKAHPKLKFQEQSQADRAEDSRLLRATTQSGMKGLRQEYRWKLVKDLGEPTSYLDQLYWGCSQRQCKPDETIIDKYRKIFESRISPGATEKIAGRTETSRKNCRVVIQYGMSCEKVHGNIWWADE